MRRRLHSCVPRKSELKDEHLLMGAAYGGGAFVTHTVFGMLLISLAYVVVFVIQIHDLHKM